jgi:hypothetical protein
MMYLFYLFLNSQISILFKAQSASASDNGRQQPVPKVEKAKEVKPIGLLFEMHPPDGDGRHIPSPTPSIPVAVCLHMAPAVTA